MLDIEAARRNPFRNLLEGQVAIVTGGGTGIGLRHRARAAALGAQGGDLRPQAGALEAGARRARARTARRSRCRCDIREPAAGRGASSTRCSTRFGRIDVLVNNAGGQFPSPAAAHLAQGLGRGGPQQPERHLLHDARGGGARDDPRKRGAIVNVIANVARGFPGMAHTGAARAGVENLTQSLADRVGGARRARQRGRAGPDRVERHRSSIRPSWWRRARRARRKNAPGTVEEVAHAIVYLASPAARFVTGATCSIDGGASLWGDIVADSRSRRRESAGEPGDRRRDCGGRGGAADRAALAAKEVSRLPDPAAEFCSPNNAKQAMRWLDLPEVRD